QRLLLHRQRSRRAPAQAREASPLLHAPAHPHAPLAAWLGGKEARMAPRASSHAPANPIVTVRWALILTCAYLMLLGRGSGVPTGVGPLLIAAYLTSNLLVGRARQPLTQVTKLGIAVLDSAFIAASLWVAGQLSVELLLLCL